ncbi:hypothetical protein [Candidatus Marithrix sp. Canyon 246]|uniref:hypothetical protein n=1 Tax=Candidatus Marithrix sp. Canyon 246 TaxID=1827136 RepID=UPI00084A079D|nr:hypothetical protein [Candidatus Marithrix sp. Canyon 246]
MMLTEVIDKVQFVVDTKGNKKAAQLDFPIWEALVQYLKEIEQYATEELLEMPGIVDAIEQSKQRMQSGKFVRYEDIKRNV